MKCANCDRPALYVYEGSGIRAVGYCDGHLPRFLQAPAKKGSLRTTDAYAATQRSALSALAPITAVAVDAPAEPEPVVEPAPAPAPKKRRRKTVDKTEAAPAETVEETAVEDEVVEPAPEVAED